MKNPFAHVSPVLGNLRPNLQTWPGHVKKGTIPSGRYASCPSGMNAPSQDPTPVIECRKKEVTVNGEPMSCLGSVKGIPRKNQAKAAFPDASGDDVAEDYVPMAHMGGCAKPTSESYIDQVIERLSTPPDNNAGRVLDEVSKKASSLSRSHTKVGMFAGCHPGPAWNALWLGAKEAWADMEFPWFLGVHPPLSETFQLRESEYGNVFFECVASWAPEKAIRSPGFDRPGNLVPEARQLYLSGALLTCVEYFQKVVDARILEFVGATINAACGIRDILKDSLTLHLSPDRTILTLKQPGTGREWNVELEKTSVQLLFYDLGFVVEDAWKAIEGNENA
ncbi:MAG: hypothetical protein JKY94_16710 [Rhodobacteraceae bacterium]|nr:hypothetical protein [Paracoccaceae bacterium]